MTRLEMIVLFPTETLPQGIIDWLFETIVEERPVTGLNERK